MPRTADSHHIRYRHASRLRRSQKAHQDSPLLGNDAHLTYDKTRLRRIQNRLFAGSAEIACHRCNDGGITLVGVRQVAGVMDEFSRPADWTFHSHGFSKQYDRQVINGHRLLVQVARQRVWVVTSCRSMRTLKAGMKILYVLQR